MKVSTTQSGCHGTLSTGKGRFLELPAAPRINARIRFAVTTAVPARHLTPDEALSAARTLAERDGAIDSIGISGPGDPLAFIEPTLETLGLLHGHFPSMPFFIRTLGIGGEKYADKLSKTGVTHVDLLVNAVTGDILEKLYAWIRPGFKTLRLQESAAILLAEQKKAVRAFKDAGMTVTIVTTVYPENNDGQIEAIAKKMAELGADAMALVPYRPEEGAEINLAVPDQKTMETARRNAGRHIDLSEEEKPAITLADEAIAGTGLPKPTPERPNVAVVSSNGMDIDMHLGEAVQVLIYGPRADGLACLLETRPAPEPGGGGVRWERLADTLHDCFAILAASAGDNPRKILGGRGIKILVLEEGIEGVVDVLYGGGKKRKKGRR